MLTSEDKSKIAAFYNGIREGISLYAYWKDGVQYVGTTGKTLEQALKEVSSEEKQKLEEIKYHVYD